MAASADLKAGRYDRQVRRLAQRVGRMRGCRVYIPAEELQLAGFPLDGPIYYRTVAFPRTRQSAARVLVNLYTAP